MGLSLVMLKNVLLNTLDNNTIKIKKVKVDCLENKSDIFTSKGDVLKILQSKVKYSKIEKILILTVEEWELKQEKLLKDIQRLFKKRFVVVRSSALGEDSTFQSGAGNYESVLNVNSSSKKDIINSINKVIDSYKFKGNPNKQNQVIIQKQTLNSIVNGVIFTRIPKNGSPYYVINFNENNDTESVTKGQKSNAMKIFKNISLKKIPEKWQKVLLAVKELEKILENDHIDIEFAITKNEIIIFQVRPITTINSKISKNDEKVLEKLIFKNKKLFKKIINSKTNSPKSSYFSDMTDWNPAEIIGNSPNSLDYSLYDYLIMKDAWSKGRENIGYQKMKNSQLMVKFGNKPYVDIRESFISLIPDNIKKKYKTRLLKFYFTKLENSPFLHDKVEFEILFTCYDLTTKKRLQELLQYGFSKTEINDIKKDLIQFTNNIINQFSENKKMYKYSIKQMEKNRQEVIQKLKNNGMSHVKQIEGIKKLLDDCKKFGTIPFSSMARIAFIANSLLKSLEKENKIPSDIVEKFMNSVNTPLSEFQESLNDLQQKRISKKEFLEKYGHLRPGTYDITALPYNNQISLFKDLQNIKLKSHSKDFHKEYFSNMKLTPLKFKKIEFLDFIKEALIERENLKFEFTKNLSEILEIITNLGSSFGFTRDEMANLDIKFILNTVNKTNTEIKQKWEKEIQKEIEKKNLNEKLVLPSIIFSENDFEVIKHYDTKPNFITSKKITSEVVQLKKNERIPNINGKIILIENADPGYDWIFTKKPKALVTKYGGVASHMAIRCAEINLPAAIGCGELLFEQLTNSKKVMLDCHNEQLISLEDVKTNELMEIKKTLKTLGYIK